MDSFAPESSPPSRAANPPQPKLLWLVVLTTGILVFCSSLRHALFQSGYLDLGWFDQGVYLISRGRTPMVSFLGGLHILGDHAAWILYPLASLYWLFADIHWLLLIQAVALAMGSYPLWFLAIQAGLKPILARTMVGLYLLYPLVFNVNLFDFHPEVIALPLLLAAVLAARQQYLGWFCLCLVLISGCKAVLSLTIASLGVWLLTEKRYRYGWIALGFGLAWFLLTTQVIIPHFSGREAYAVNRYAYLGSSVLEIALNLLLKPGPALAKVFSFDTLGYLLLLVAPVIWCLSPRRLSPLIAAIPPLVLNILSDRSVQRDLVHQYSLAVLPFLLLAVIASLARGETMLQRPRWILLWSVIGFMALAKFGYFGSLYLESLDTWSATHEAIAQVRTAEPVLTTHSIAPHLTHRQVIDFTHTDAPPDLNAYRYVLLNLRHPGYESTAEFATQLRQQLSQNPRFSLAFQKEDVYLFIQKASLPPASGS